MPNILLLFAHPALHRSRVNSALWQAAKALPEVTARDLYAEYPDFNIEQEREQNDLLAHDIIVWQHPFYWYSAPALLKEWQDVVLEYGFAYGEAGTQLHGKRLLSVVTTGGPAEAYQPEGYNHFTMSQLMTPFEQTARLCSMEYLEPLIFHGVNRLSKAEIQQAAGQYQTRLLELAKAPPEQTKPVE
jgi:glutathione-regulated potassium-efflux system ancillary protein KefG